MLTVISLLIIVLVGIRIDKFIHKPIKYKGLCLFDIDGTLTDGTENEAVVQYCIDKGYAVGIVTAGSIYHPNNLLSYNWMPINLYNFMKKNNFNTFNNVASGILLGKHNLKSYSIALLSKPRNIFWAGWLKGLALDETAKLYKLLPNKIYIFDNDPDYLTGIKYYNNNFNCICAGMPCNGILSLEHIKKVIL